MNLSDQVVSLELAKKMNWLGFNQESVWWWNGTKCGIGGQIVGLEPMKWILSKRIKGSAIDNYSAFTVAELGEMLPDEVKCTVGTAKLGTNCKDFVYYYKQAPHIAICYDEVGDTEANARAKMLIYLKENKLL